MGVISMKKRKVIVSLFLVITMLLGTCSVGFAETSLKENKVVINEYELFKELSLKSKAELSTMGYSSINIAEINDYHQIYVDHLNELKQLDDSTLVSEGYTSKQIKILRNFDGSEVQASLLGATLTIYSTPVSFNYDGNYTRGRLGYTWSWAGVPAFKMQDAVAVSWNAWAVESNTSYVSYYNVNTGSYYTQTSATFTTDGNGTEGAGHKFNVSMSDNYYYAKSGGGSFNVRSDVHTPKDFFYYIAYGHSQLVASINFSIGIGGGDGSISFTFGSVIADSDKGEYNVN